MNLKDLIKPQDGIAVYNGDKSPCRDIPALEVSLVSCNSRENLRDAVFVAIKGAQADGHAFIQDAIRRGAKAVVFEDKRRINADAFSPDPGCGAVLIQVPDSKSAMVEMAQAFYGYPSRLFDVTGITGTNGKTTVSYLLESVVLAAGKTPAVIGTVNYRFKDKIITSVNTTPGLVELQRLFREMADAGVTHLAMEVSSHALDQGRVAGINFSSAVFTNLTQDHLD
ncbi:MAG: Mur ligase family protein, partial [Candidatus Omnitrophica bacterium]|nr:Mur ligase family protein [Candidatus Omnitrophota bacterium]